LGRSDKDLALLESLSPLKDVNTIRVPLFVYAGANDPRMPRSERDQIVKAVREHGVAVEVHGRPQRGALAGSPREPDRLRVAHRTLPGEGARQVITVRTVAHPLGRARPLGVDIAGHRIGEDVLLVPLQPLANGLV